MQRYTNLVQDNTGIALSGVTVTVYNAGTVTLSTIYSSNAGASKTNPFTNDSDGTVEFYAANGRYDIVYAKSGYTFVAANTTDILFEDTSDGLGTGAVISAGLVVATGTSSSRTLATRFAETLNVKDYGALGDGVTSDQTAIVNAVAAAAASGQELFWPDGDYITTATIASFHSVRHRGPGILKRSSNSFYVDPRCHDAITNNLYVSTSGDNTNDGLTSSQPRLTVQSMGDVIYKYPYSNATWVVNLAAGTYNTTGIAFSKPFPTPNRVQFLGPSVAVGVQPTAIIQGSGSAQEIGLYFQNYVRAQVSNVNFKRFRAGASPNANVLGIGLAADTFCELYSVNIWTDDCDHGIYITNSSEARIEAGRHGFNAINGSGVQFIRHASGTVGYNGGGPASATGDKGVAFIGGTYGVMAQEFSMCHTDDCYFDTQTSAGTIINHSRVHSVSSTYINCVLGIDARYNSNLGVTTPTFTTCTDNFFIRSGSRWASAVASEAEGLAVGPPVKEIDAVGASTQSATDVNILTRAFTAQDFRNRTSGLKWTGHFDVTGVANTKIVTVKVDATTILTATIAAGTLEYMIEVDMMQVTAASSQKWFTKIIENGVTPTVAYTTTALDFTGARTFTVDHKVSNVADLNRFGFGILEIQH